MRAFFVFHNHNGDDKFIGAFYDRERAEDVVADLMGKDGFRDFKECFRISIIESGLVHWGEGFFRKGDLDIPVWAQGAHPEYGESCKDFADRLTKEKYRGRACDKGFNSEYDAIIKMCQGVL